jgi:hypothetical protein
MIKTCTFPSTAAIVLHSYHQIAYVAAMHHGGHGIQRTDLIDAGTTYKLTVSHIDIHIIQIS